MKRNRKILIKGGGKTHETVSSDIWDTERGYKIEGKTKNSLYGRGNIEEVFNKPKNLENFITQDDDYAITSHCLYRF